MRPFESGSDAVPPATKIFGLVGYPLSHSFSKRYFENKFAAEGLNHCVYLNFELPEINQLPEIIQAHPGLAGLNVTIPHKQSVIPLLHHLDPVARGVGAVNTIRVEKRKGGLVLTGFNTDVTGFEASLKAFIGVRRPAALVLGTGGASLAVNHVLQRAGIPFFRVSRQDSPGALTYSQLTEEIIRNHPLIINCTPLGTWPDVDGYPPIPYEGIGEGHYLYDLVYNPETTAFMAKGLGRGAQVRNGYDMLVRQAEASWQIWNG